MSTRGPAIKRFPGRPTSVATGFTLIELAVVVLILVIMLSLVTVNLTRDEADLVRDEADRLTLLLQTAQQEAIMQGRVFVVDVSGDGYRFLVLNDLGELKLIGSGDILGPRTLSPLVTVAAVTVEGTQEDEKRHIVFDPSGTLSPFTITLSAGRAVRSIEGTATGKIQPALKPPAHA